MRTIIMCVIICDSRVFMASQLTNMNRLAFCDARASQLEIISTMMVLMTITASLRWNQFFFLSYSLSLEYFSLFALASHTLSSPHHHGMDSESQMSLVFLNEKPSANENAFKYKQSTKLFFSSLEHNLRIHLSTQHTTYKLIHLLLIIFPLEKTNGNCSEFLPY